MNRKLAFFLLICYLPLFAFADDFDIGSRLDQLVEDKLKLSISKNFNNNEFDLGDWCGSSDLISREEIKLSQKHNEIIKKAPLVFEFVTQREQWVPIDGKIIKIGYWRVYL